MKLTISVSFSGFLKKTIFMQQQEFEISEFKIDWTFRTLPGKLPQHWWLSVFLL